MLDREIAAFCVGLVSRFSWNVVEIAKFNTSKIWYVCCHKSVLLIGKLQQYVDIFLYFSASFVLVNIPTLAFLNLKKLLERTLDFTKIIKIEYINKNKQKYCNKVYHYYNVYHDSQTLTLSPHKQQHVCQNMCRKMKSKWKATFHLSNN